MQVWEEVWVGDGFEPSPVKEGWWLHDQLADWRWHNEGLYWQERVGVGVARKMLKFRFMQDIYELELYHRMWPYNMAPVLEDWKRRCA